MGRYDLSKAEWRLVEPLLPNKPRGIARVDDRRVINGIFYVLWTGSPWRDLPSRYGPRTTVYNLYNSWAKAVWNACPRRLRAHPTQRDRKVQRSIDPAIYRQRNQIERFFCKLKHFRRVAARFDEPARNFLAAVLLASTSLCLRAYESTT